MRCGRFKNGRGRSLDFGLALALAAALVPAAPARARAQQASLVSVRGDGAGSASGGSAIILSSPAAQRQGPSSSVVTPDGRFVVFASEAHDLVAAPAVAPGSPPQIYVRDRWAGTTRLVSVNRAGTGGGNNVSFEPAISHDGRYVVFNSFASDLVASDTNGVNDIFVRDLEAGTTTLVSVNRAGTDSGRGAPRLLNGRPHHPLFFNEEPMMSTDGRRVVFLSYADDLVEGDANNSQDIFVRDLAAGRTSCVSVNRQGVPSGNHSRIVNEGGLFSFDPEMSADGRFVVFVSYVNDLVENDTVCAGPCDGTNGVADVFVRDVEEGRTTLVSVNAAGTAGGNSSSLVPSISADGGRVAFRSAATDLSANDTTTQFDIYVRDLRAGTTALVSAGPSGKNGVGINASFPLISGDGRFVAFSSPATDLAPNKTDILVLDVFVRDLFKGTTTLVSVNRSGNDGGRPININSVPQAVSHDGRFVVFNSNASDLVEGDTNGAHDAFVRDLVRGTTVPLNLNRAGSFSAGHASGDGRMTADARVLIFESWAPDIVEGDANGAQDVFARLLFAGNPVDDTHFFVRTHYLDFLGRDPDPEGFEFWVEDIEKCGADAACREVKRINVSAAFFLSIEFQETGFLSYRARKAAFGNLPDKPVPVTREEMLADVRLLGAGLVVGAAGWQEKLEQNKRAYFDQLVASARFAAAYPQSLTAEQFVDALNANAGGALSQAERDTLVSDLTSGAKTRAQTLRAVAEDADLTRAELNKAFVLMQYFGYLRRDPDAAPDSDFSGWQHWLSKLESFGGNFVQAEMVKAFITSDEYRNRFTR